MMSEVSVRESVAQFEKVLNKLAKALARPLESDELILDAVIQRFEFTFELCWKTLQKFLVQEGFSVASPKQALQKSYALGWIQDEPLWLEMLEDRNLTSHTYHEEKALRIHGHLKRYLPEFQKLYEFFQEHVQKSEP